MMNDQNTDVLIIGAGPSGLMLGCLLAKNGVKFRIIDKRKHLKQASGALVIHQASMEIFEQLNLSNQVLDAATVVNSISIQWSNNIGICIPLKNNDNKLSAFPTLLLLEQYFLELILEKFLNSHGYHVERGVEAISIESNINGSSAKLIDQNKNMQIPVCKFLVGADGKNSLTRDALKIWNTYNVILEQIFVLDFEGECPAKISQISFSFSNRGSVGIFPLKNSLVRLDGTIPKNLLKKQKIILEDILPHLPDGISIKNAKWFSVFHANHLVSSTFNRSNCFLIGDSAHTFNPVGGQGMNSGFQDSFNLAWKLDFVLKGLADHSILETYSLERKPCVENIMNKSRFFFDLITSRKPLRKLIWLKTGYIGTHIFKQLLKNKHFNSFIIKSISQLWLKYSGRLVIENNMVSGPKPGELFRSDYIPANLVNSGLFKLLFYVDHSIEVSELESLNLPTKVEIIKKSSISKLMLNNLKVNGSRMYLIRPDNIIAIVSDEINLNQVKTYFYNLKHG